MAPSLHSSGIFMNPTTLRSSGSPGDGDRDGSTSTSGVSSTSPNGSGSLSLAHSITGTESVRAIGAPRLFVPALRLAPGALLLSCVLNHRPIVVRPLAMLLRLPPRGVVALPYAIDTCGGASESSRGDVMPAGSLLTTCSGDEHERGRMPVEVSEALPLETLGRTRPDKAGESSSSPSRSGVVMSLSSESPGSEYSARRFDDVAEPRMRDSPARRYAAPSAVALLLRFSGCICTSIDTCTCEWLTSDSRSVRACFERSSSPASRSAISVRLAVSLSSGCKTVSCNVTCQVSACARVHLAVAHVLSIEMKSWNCCRNTRAWRTNECWCSSVRCLHSSMDLSVWPWLMNATKKSGLLSTAAR